MKKWLLIFSLSVLIIAACEYQEPAADKQGIPVNPALLGLWVPSPDNKETPPPDEWILALPYSDTEYMIHYRTEKDSMYFKGYPVKIGAYSCIHLQLIGDSRSPISKTDAPYQIASVSLSGEEVTIRMMSTSVVSSSLRGTALKEAVLKNANNAGLFREPVKFRRADKSYKPWSR